MASNYPCRPPALRPRSPCLSALQAENELAVERIKGMQAAHRQELAAATEEAERLRQQLAAAEAAGAAAAQPGGSPGGVDAARLQEVLSLQSRLEAAEAAAAQREQELRQKLTEARQEKAALQAQLEQLESQGTQVGGGVQCCERAGSPVL